jgi:cell filamentation protein
MSRYSSSDPYVDLDTGVLLNRLGIANQSLLERAEARLVSIRSQQLWLNPPDGHFDISHLKNVHRQLFQDVYEWAGEFRTVDISKGDNRFAHHAYLEAAAAAIFIKLKDEGSLAGMSRREFCIRAAYYLGEINALHPFREGNGRTSREWVGLLARRNGFIFCWKSVHQAEWMQASIESFRGRLEGLTKILEKAIEPISR